MTTYKLNAERQAIDDNNNIVDVSEFNRLYTETECIVFDTFDEYCNYMGIIIEKNI